MVCGGKRCDGDGSEHKLHLHLIPYFLAGNECLCICVPRRAQGYADKDMNNILYSGIKQIA